MYELGSTRTYREGETADRLTFSSSFFNLVLFGNFSGLSVCCFYCRFRHIFYFGWMDSVPDVQQGEKPNGELCT